MCVKGITYKQAELKEDLHKLHDALLQELGYAMPVLHTGEFHREVDPHPLMVHEMTSRFAAVLSISNSWPMRVFSA